ncbi:signal peptide peptidase SppA [Bacteroides sp. 214]|uniref:signal peptide peptidase SppA n=1 Tax=Bacteroides sp. 214 TaxID=2302935 RepID=UPI0013D0C811|nr:signal peptide peptidase SppA [Bacteroides sp. 214]NDW12363.1 signal peptide peptidase SppA [Bacteroides sp. 214]
MKDFLKYTLATITGLIIAGVVLFLISVVSLAGILSTSETETIVKKNSVMMLTMDGGLSERSIDNPFDKLFGDNMTTYGLDDILASIKKAKEHEDIKGIYIHAEYLTGASFASRQEIRDALVDFKESGKFIVAYADAYTQGLYYMASVADKVLLNPIGKIEWRGLASQPTFYKELLAKLGIEMQIVRVGTYKAAVEPFIEDKMSDANREQINAYINSVWDQQLAGVSESRNLSKEKLNEIADKMLIFYPSEECVAEGLVDTLIYKNDVRDYLKKMVGVDEDDKLNTLSMNDMKNIKRNVPKDKSGNIVAVYYAYGDIDMGSSSSVYADGINSSKVIRDLRKLKEDKNVKAVVLRINSGGGSAFGSEQMWYAIEELKKEKPVVVSMGDYAASGGYYMACNADCIVAEPTTLTGSIGVFGMFPSFGELSKKVGLKYDLAKTNKFSDFGNMTRPLNTDEQALLQMMVNQTYDLFLTRCSEGRDIPKEELAKIAEGRIWTGVMAKELKLVDELGGLDKALSIAVEKAEVENYTLVSYPAKKSVFSSILEEKPTNYIQNKLIKSNLGDYYKSFRLLQNMENADFMQARVPFELSIN